MKRIDTNSVGIQQGSRVLFSDFVDDGPMWTGNGDRESRVRVHFPQAFIGDPSVHVSIGMYDIGNVANIRADISAADISAFGFDVVFRTWGDTRIARIRVDWLAIGPTKAADDWQLY